MASPERATGGVLCCGLNCLDMMLLNTDTPASTEQIVAFERVSYVAGGSCCNTARALCRSGVRAGVWSVIGNDSFGEQMQQQLDEFGAHTELLIKDDRVSTSLAILPVFKNGTRGCFVNLGANLSMDQETLLNRSRRANGEAAVLEYVRSFDLVHFGYPHLLPRLQGERLAQFFTKLRAEISDLILTLDVNGANTPDDSILGPALTHVGMLHANLEEAYLMVKKEPIGEREPNAQDIHELLDHLLDRGVALVAITLGKRGACLKLNKDPVVLHKNLGRALSSQLVAGTSCFLQALEPQGSVNATGAGDAFTAGMLAAMAAASSRGIVLEDIAQCGLLAALEQIDTSSRCKASRTKECDFLSEARQISFKSF
ncbi:putative sugar kinase YdjH [Porphyridium purpureum]|uniref:Putative sugar kinase YdjH n=1 Tax=Porphyridium purpureum TaxID=35688 RepID=A0A5J4YR21_PORPP|nr:putative sugar kinase YdjH [Porphyridium purpureum]|eukprot:POR3291..scf236_6